MKNKIKYFLYSLLAFLVLVVSPKAMSLSIDGNSKVIVNKEFTISVSVSGVSDGIAAGDFILKYDSSKVKYISTTIGQSKPNSDLFINANLNNELRISYVDNQNGLSPLKNGSILTFKFKNILNNEGTINFNLQANKLTNTQGGLIGNFTAAKTITSYKPSNASFLESLSVDKLSLTPKFNKETKSYKLPDTEKSSIYLRGKGADKSKVSGLGTRKLKIGDNNLKVTVTAEDGITKTTYTIHVKRIDNRSVNNELSSLTIDDIDFAFDPSKSIYDINIPSNITKIKINAILKDTKAKLEGIGEIDLSKKVKSHTIKVTAENGSVNLYSLRFNYEEDSNTNQDSNIISTKLKTLNINDKEIKLTNNNSYLIGVPNSVNNLNIKYTTISKTATVEIINNENLIVGINKVTIKVVDNNEVEEYTLLVNKEPNYNKVYYLTDINEQKLSGNLLIELNTSNSNVLDSKTLQLIKNSKSKVLINMVNEYGGLLYSLSLDNVKSDKDINLNILNTKINPYTLETTLPAGISVKYYLKDNISTGKLYGFKSDKDSYVLIDKQPVVINDYLNFTTNDSSKYLYTNEEIKKEKKPLPSFVYILIGMASGSLLTLLVQFVIKHKDELFKKKQEEPVLNNILQNENQPLQSETLDLGLNKQAKEENILVLGDENKQSVDNSLTQETIVSNNIPVQENVVSNNIPPQEPVFSNNYQATENNVIDLNNGSETLTFDVPEKQNNNNNNQSN